MIRASLALVIAFAAGCPASTTVSDLAIVTGCHQPEACIDPNCDCVRGDAIGGSCVICQPQVSVDNCGSCGEGDGGTCAEPSQICFGRGPVCEGAGATCVAAGDSCGSDTAAPPELVEASDGGIHKVLRCTYVDDICCPGTADLSAVVPMDLGGRD
jgi:hypothetical protein